MTKTCLRCGVEKEATAFTLNKYSEDGRHRYCKECKNVLRRANYASNSKAILAKNREWFKTNPDKTAESKRKEYIKHRDMYKVRFSKYYLSETLAQKEQRKLYQRTHKGERNARHALRMSTDIQYRLRHILHTRLSRAVSNNNKRGSAVSDLGCSIQHLKLHLELFWDEGMAWSNYGKGERQWSIDHIKPLASFDLTDRTQLLQAVHYTNLQPLWHIDNMTKGKT